MAFPPLSLDKLVPGGVRPTDHLHRETTDHTCSRCRRDTSEGVPLMLWTEDGNDLYIFCTKCLEGPANDG